MLGCMAGLIGLAGLFHCELRPKVMPATPPVGSGFSKVLLSDKLSAVTSPKLGARVNVVGEMPSGVSVRFHNKDVFQRVSNLESDVSILVAVMAGSSASTRMASAPEIAVPWKPAMASVANPGVAG